MAHTNIDECFVLIVPRVSNVGMLYAYIDTYIFR